MAQCSQTVHLPSNKLYLWWEKIREKWLDFNQVFEENKLSLFYAMLAIFNNFAYGVTSFIIGPTVTDLSYIYDVPVKSIWYFNACFYSGSMLGSGGNYLYKWFNRQLFLVFFVMLAAVTIALVPHYSHIPLAYAMVVLSGIGSGVWDAGSFIWMIEVWPSRIGELFQMNQFTYNLGAAMAGLLAKPFVMGDVDMDELNRTVTVRDRRRSLSFPYAINGYLQSIIPFIFFALYFINSYQLRPIISKAHNHHMNPFLPTTKVSRRKRKLTLYFVWNLLYYLAEVGYFQYFGSTFAQVGFTQKQIHYSTVAFTITYTLGPLITIFAYLKLRIDYIIIYNYVFIVFGLVINYFGYPDGTFILVGNIFLGLGLSPVMPAMMTFAENVLRLNDHNVSVCSFLNSFVWCATPFIVEYGQTLTPWFIFLYEAVLIPITIALFIIFRWWMFHNSKKFNFYMENMRNIIDDNNAFDWWWK